MKIKLSSEIWNQLTGQTVLDPDGWNRSDVEKFKIDWQKPITFDEFWEKLCASTCRRHKTKEAIHNDCKRIIKEILNACFDD